MPLFKRLLKTLVLLTVLLIAALAIHTASIHWNWFGVHQDAGKVTETSLPAHAIERKFAQLQAAGASKQILFGDMHVHTTFSKDAFIMSLPLLGGRGAHPPADACDVARYCAGLDFWGISDHAEGLTAEHWAETRSSIQQCNAVAGDADNPDMVAFLGWEWSQTGSGPENHYGHKNVFFKDTADDKVPARPIGSGTAGLPATAITAINTGLALLDFDNRQYYYDHQQFMREYTGTMPCPTDIPSRQLPIDCEEVALTPEVLNRKLDEWAFDSVIIPHGNAWGITSPLGADFSTQLNHRDFNPARETLIEIFSGHGSSEHYRRWREVAYAEDGSVLCPQASEHYVPGCRRAGEIIFSRCMQAGIGNDECLARQQRAQQNYIDAGLLKGFLTVPGATFDEWGTSDQCEDCFLPAYNYIPRASAQYALAIGNFDDPEKPLRYRFGFIGSSDNHAGKSGTGYKEFDRNLMSESRTPKSQLLKPLIEPARGEATLESIPAAALPSGLAMDRERYASFTLTGGTIAVHSDSRRRDDIWSAIKQREVYATSGPQILLWFDYIQRDPKTGDELTSSPMGSEITTTNTPSFRVRAAGSFEQKPGCPDFVHGALGQQRIDSLCQGECFNPSDKRYRISRIEVTRIHPQSYRDEPIENLIEETWRSFECPPSNEACEIEFEDTDFGTSQRDSVYYVRAIQEPTEMVNGDPFRCEQQNNQGQCVKYRRCDVSNPNDQCMGMNEERAWSSPIFIDYQR